MAKECLIKKKDLFQLWNIVRIKMENKSVNYIFKGKKL
jgi:hypothetical protein